MSIIVFGSINIDLVATVPRLPIAGETLLGHKFLQIPGGKGANQAVALARLGIHTRMVGRVGTDSFQNYSTIWKTLV
jgi:ribokinase